MGPVTVFINNHEVINRVNIIAIVRTRPLERFKSHFGHPFETCKIKSPDTYGTWAEFQKFYSNWWAEGGLYQQAGYPMYETIVLLPDCEISLT